MDEQTKKKKLASACIISVHWGLCARGRETETSAFPPFFLLYALIFHHTERVRSPIMVMSNFNYNDALQKGGGLQQL